MSRYISYIFYIHIVIIVYLTICQNQYEHIVNGASDTSKRIKNLRRSRRAAVSLESQKWPNGIIPYIIDYSSFSYMDIWILNKAFATLHLETCVTFRPYERRDQNWIRIKDGTICHSYVGMEGKGEQDVTLSRNGCRFYGLYLHELSHVLGLAHEHVRPERSHYIRIHKHHIPVRNRRFYERKEHRLLESYGTPYDLQSIMHYGAGAFLNHNNEALMSVRNSSQRHLLKEVYTKDLSFNDANVLNLYYQCSNGCATNMNCLARGGYVNKHCQCVTPQSFSQRRCRNLRGDGYCQRQFQEGKCETEIPQMAIGCRRICNWCYLDNSSMISPTQYVCRDLYNPVRCSQWANRGECAANPGWMLIHCRKTCAACPTADTSIRYDGADMEEDLPTETPLPECCKNIKPNWTCLRWALAGECSTNHRYMKQFCARACRQCKSAERSSDHNIDCVNKFNDTQCNMWASMDECRKNPEWMKINCSLSCRHCI